MGLQEATLLSLTHGIPILFFAFVAFVVLLRNHRRTEHILLSLLAVCYILLFAVDYVRRQSAVESNVILESQWLICVGIMIQGLGFHFLVKFTGIYKRMPRWLYPHVFYLPFIFAAVNLLTGAQIIAAHHYAQTGTWIQLYSGIIWSCFLQYALMKKHDSLNLHDKRFETLFLMSSNAILLIDSSRSVKNTNPSAVRLFESLRLEFAQFYELLDPAIKSRIQSRMAIRQYEAVIIVVNRRHVLLMDADYVLVDNELHMLIILQDITQQKMQQEEIHSLAYYDPLTQLPNRRFFYERLDAALRTAEEKQETIALLLFDLDKIKLLNDTRGHLAGDEALQLAAKIMTSAAADRGEAARMGGDEFIMYLQHTPAVDVERLIRHMQDEFTRGIMARYGAVPIGLSVGVSYYPADGTDGQALINAADLAMYTMKRQRQAAHL